jgi:alcohol dehydrogenase
MRAMVYTAPETLELREVARPTSEPDAVILRVDAVGVCGSDLHAFKGHDPRRQPPLILGHEFVGTAISGPQAGRRFTANPLVTCGRCRFCREERDNLCSDRTMIGMNRPGAFAPALAVPLGCLVPVPDTLSDRGAALTEPAATVVHALALAERARVAPLGDARALVFGAGAIGLLTALLLRGRGAASVAVVETNPLRAATLLAATGIVAVEPAALDSSAGAFDLVVDAVGVGATRDAAIAAVASGGVVVHVGLGDWASPLDWRQLTLREITLIGAYTYRTADLHAAVAALDRGEFGDLGWVEERPLEQGPAAFADLVSGRVGAAKILLRPEPVDLRL